MTDRRDSADAGRRDRPDLRRQYGSIGIGAVAAALAVNSNEAGRQQDENKSTKSGVLRQIEPMAA